MSSQAEGQPSLEDAVRAYQRGEAQRAESLCRQCLKNEPGNDQASLLLSGLLLHRQAHEEAAHVLSAALALQPDHPRLLANQSLAQRGCGRIEESAELAARASELDPSLLSAWNALGIALMEAERYEQAEARLREALTHHPDQPALLHHLSQVIERQGRHAQAMETRASLSRAGTERGREAARLVSQGRLGEAEPIFREAIGLHPSDAFSHSGLGCLLLRLGRHEEAITCLERALELTPDDAVSRHFLAAARGQPPAHAAGEYVRNVFDAYAEQFDQHLVEQLGYRVPEDLSRALLARGTNGAGDVLDLGCGTGLVGQHLAGHCSAIDGVDLSAAMLIKAGEKNIYRDLHVAEIGEFVGQTSGIWHSVVAADVFIYFGEVAELFKQLKDHMHASGCLAFSVESSSNGLELNPASGRYRHGRDYLLNALEQAGFGQIEFTDTVIRQEHGQPINGWLVTALRGSG